MILKKGNVRAKNKLVFFYYKYLLKKILFILKANVVYSAEEYNLY